MTEIIPFDAAFGRRFSVSVDTEEEFVWGSKFSRHEHDVQAAEALRGGQYFFESAGVVPMYYIDQPIVDCAVAVDAIAGAVSGGRAEVGVHLHPWVTPPFVERVNRHNSYAGNLDPKLEREKLCHIRDAIAAAFGTIPRAYRAGRYGIGPNSHQILIEEGFQCDSSVRALFDYSADGGPDFTHAQVTPYWTDATRRLVELPLSTYFVGWGGALKGPLYRASERVRLMRSAIGRSGFARRIALTPEGTPLSLARKMIDTALNDGARLLNISFHSPSLAIGHTPYVRDASDLRHFYAWFDGVFEQFAKHGVESASLSDILAATERVRPT